MPKVLTVNLARTRAELLEGTGKLSKVAGVRLSMPWPAVLCSCVSVSRLKVVLTVATLGRSEFNRRCADSLQTETMKPVKRSKQMAIYPMLTDWEAVLLQSVYSILMGRSNAPIRIPFDFFAKVSKLIMWKVLLQKKHFDYKIKFYRSKQCNTGIKGRRRRS